eukprot:INCI6201.4.p3 GENE.INCI6201.4~~INCI6201.4.p3  ORF type:complete len:136 (-),score=17.37 INCI6201.4:1380-1787(-)
MYVVFVTSQGRKSPPLFMLLYGIYITGCLCVCVCFAFSWFYMNNKFAGRMREGVLANANAGGENVHRGELFGLALGAHEGTIDSIADLVSGLKDHAQLKAEIDAFVTCVCNQPPTAAGPAESDESHDTAPAPATS